MEKVRPWCSQPSDRGRLKNRTEQNCHPMHKRHVTRLTISSMLPARSAARSALWRSTTSVVSAGVIGETARRRLPPPTTATIDLLTACFDQVLACDLRDLVTRDEKTRVRERVTASASRPNSDSSLIAIPSSPSSSS